MLAFRPHAMGQAAARMSPTSCFRFPARSKAKGGVLVSIDDECRAFPDGHVAIVDGAKTLFVR
jgi:hypothetical protein